MNTKFRDLLDDALAEILSRDPSYPQRFQLCLPAMEDILPEYLRHPLCAELAPDMLEESLSRGLAYFAESWPASTPTKRIDDPVTRFVYDSIVDALCADQGILELQPQVKIKTSIHETLAGSYAIGKTDTGLGYFIRNRGTRPLLLINSTGVPIDIWHSFLADPEHDFRIIVPKRRGVDIVKGGLLEPVDIGTEFTDLASILDAESIESADVVAWCNGARLALELTSLQPGRIASIVLVTPTFKGMAGAVAAPSQFERDLQLLFDSVLQQPDLAEFFCQTISEQGRELPDWDRLGDQPANRSQKLFEMPARKYAGLIVAPMTEAESFVNMAHRVASDENHRTEQALQKLAARVLILMGSHDHIVSNSLTLWALEHIQGNSVETATVSAAGHYVHDLQYRYFRLLLNRFLLHHVPFLSTARISSQLSPAGVTMNRDVSGKLTRAADNSTSSTGHWCSRNTIP